MKSKIAILSLILSASYPAMSWDIPFGTIPLDYSLSEASNGAALYKKGRDYYAIVMDTDKSDIELGNLDYTGNVDSNGLGLYTKMKLGEHWDKYSDYSYFGMVNGQFFSHKYSFTVAPITYPVVSDGIPITTYIDNKKRDIKTLTKTWGGSYYISSGFSYGQNVDSAIVGFHKDEYLTEDDKTNKVDRLYIGGVPRNGCNPDNQTCQFKYLIFLIANNKSIPQVISEFDSWGVKGSAIIRMDGGDSAQMKTSTFEFDSDLIRSRKIPHSIGIKKYK
ncbi:hypothetical protein [Pseudoalteromonas rubra]|uniref:hypothetical protein n=1 Tax=Pseudoalteromonas rubra TaxID=43658 RepID=UPI002DBCD644|nr:hypothetical protein [Pseudoalteromonas rubra]MEC4090913.1 hypothetical protein [Pseudoalteromonas rubra]